MYTNLIYISNLRKTRNPKVRQTLAEGNQDNPVTPDPHEWDFEDQTEPDK